MINSSLEQPLFSQIKASFKPQLPAEASQAAAFEAEPHGAAVKEPSTMHEAISTHSLLAQIAHPLLQLDQRGQIIFANAAAAELLATSTAHLEGRRFSQLLHHPWQQQLEQLLQQPYPGSCEQRFPPQEAVLNTYNKQGVTVFISLSLMDGEQNTYIVGLQDLTFYKEQLYQLSHLAQTDPLTGLANRRAFDDALQEQWKETCRHGQPFSMLMIDIDHFKQVNDNCGHQQGDVYLQQIAQILTQVTPETPAMAARYGGEEFAILLPAMNAEQALTIARQLAKQLEQLPPIITGEDQEPLHLSVSQGVATENNGCYRNAQALLFAADTALYRAKVEGRARINVAH